ncbi:MAG TPA: hypothetical protein DCW47_05255 [Lachnospiraceae bacterium]|nr:hypothetical protein [Lachnospiraceae bacterium]
MRTGSVTEDSRLYIYADLGKSLRIMLEGIMDGFRDRFGSRYDRSSGRSTASGSRNIDRDRGAMDRGPMDRGNERDYDYGGRNDYQSRDDYSGRRLPAQNMGGMDSVGNAQSQGGINGRQLEIIRDYFDEAKDDSKEILHAVDNNSKMLDRSLDILGELKDKAGRTVEQAPQTVDFSAPLASIMDSGRAIMDSGKANKEEIVAAIAANKELLNLIREQAAKNAEAISSIDIGEEGGGFDKEELEKYFSDLTDHVHKENVKCYRNVAGALEEYDKKSEEKGSGIGVVKVFSIIQLALTVLNVVLLALYIFRVI